MTVFEEMLKEEAAQNRKRHRLLLPFVLLGVFIAVLVCLIPIFSGSGESAGINATYFTSVCAIFCLVPGIFAILAAPIWYSSYRGFKDRQTVLEELPASGEARLVYAVNWYKKQKWVNVPPEWAKEGVVRLCEEKHFNLLTAAAALLTGNIQNYAERLHKVEVIEFELTPEGKVAVIPVYNLEPVR
jgi:hypothetical protein